MLNILFHCNQASYKYTQNKYIHNHKIINKQHQLRKMLIQTPNWHHSLDGFE